MSPALIDPRGAASSPANGQVSSVPFTLNSFGSFPVYQSESSLEKMNPSSSFGFEGDFNSGFSKSAPNNPDFSFNTPSLQRPPAGLARPRLVKIRKQLNSDNLNSSVNLETRVGPGFNPFQPVSDGSNLGVNLELEGGFVEGMRNLRIGKSCGLADQSLVSRLPDDLRKLNIQDGSKSDQSNENDSNAGSYVRRGVETETLPNELRSKLNIKSSEDVNDGSETVFVFSVGKGGDSSVGSSTDAVQDRIKNLNIKGSDDSNTNERDKFAFRSGENSYHLGGEREKVLTDVEKLIIGSVTGGSSGQTDGGFSSSHVFGKDVQTEKLDDTKLEGFGNSVKEESVFQTATSGLYPSSSVHMDQLKSNIGPGGATVLPTSFSSSAMHFQPGVSSFGLSSDKPEKKDEFCFTAKQDAVRTPFVEFKTPQSQANMLFGINKKLEFSAKKETGKSKTVKKRKGQLKHPTPVHLWHGPNFVSSKTGARDNAEASESYSPMDVSPYQETLADTRCSRESSVASDESFSLGVKSASSGSQQAVSSDAIVEDLVAATQHMILNEGEEKDEEIKIEGHGDVFDKAVATEALEEDSVSGAETESFLSAAEEIDDNSDIALSSAEKEVTSRTNIERQDSDTQMYFSATSNPEHISGFDFTFAASSSAQSQVSTPTRHHRKNNLAKVSFDTTYCSSNVRIPSASSSVQFSPYPGASVHLSPRQGQKTDLSTLQSKAGGNSVANKGPEIKHEPNLMGATAAIQESCEKWRLRGNQAYANGDSSKAEEYYTQGISCIPASETSKSCLRELMLCYSNRAATYMSLGRMKNALGDCMMAIAIDPNFSKVQLRAANCYLALGEVENSMRYFRKCLQSGTDVCLDRKIALEASDGLQKSQKLSECMHRSAELLQRRTSDDAESARELIAEALKISLYSEKLLEMKAKALFILRRYEEVIQLCEQTFDSAEKNSLSFERNGQMVNLDGSGFSKESTFRIWRCRMICKSYFHLGKLEEAIALLEKQEQLQSSTDRDGINSLESSIPLAATIRELLSHKAAGNKAFQSGRHSEAVEHYTAALSCNMESRPFAAICFCNRAASYKALGQITDAIADCSLAIALDGNYLKAISRRATLYQMIRDYGQAAGDIERFISLLTNQMETKTGQFRASDRPKNLGSDLRQARLWLTEIEEEGKKEVPLDFYLILGVEPSVSAAEIKKAYRRAALRHHPDKAVQSLVRHENGDDRLWKEIREEAYKDADKLFKIIGEAYAILSDPVKRSRYDFEEESRNVQKKHTGVASRTATDAQSYSTDRSGSRQPWREIRRAYGYSTSRGAEATRSNRFYSQF
ncbi:tetratricopeptide repeat 16, DNA J protein C31 [Hibiscus trionum]|uniref:Tetratricopeptide repeat 16, DNA J protein C31 n=1 Tax=Hibiscus trionum TaxID=183268 RepID=A0A9W7HW30_HIBTR|nr:tetratricopeptide repeat 16, DNA J protein C31 [Hibiscus trionum]